MPTLSLNTAIRLIIAKAILDSTDERNACQTIYLPDGSRLRLLSLCGHFAFDLTDDRGDLFDPHQDVSEQVLADLFGHDDWQFAMLEFNES